jgi:hypothetical protein
MVMMRQVAGVPGSSFMIGSFVTSGMITLVVMLGTTSVAQLAAVPQSVSDSPSQYIA